jgi:hypothetical protein
MSTTASPAAVSADQLRQARDATCHRVAVLLAGTGLRTAEHACALVIYNPQDLGKGRILVPYYNPVATWERIARDALGPLAGYAGDTGTTEQVGTQQILAVLASAAPPP